MTAMQRTLRPLFYVLLLSLPLGAPAAVRAESTLLFDDFRVREEWLELDFRFENGFSAKVIETMGRGLPATIEYEIELWRPRASWFDKLEASRRVSYQIQYDVIEREYRVYSPGRIAEIHPSIDELRRAVLIQRSIPIARLEDLHPRSSYYIALTARVIPIELKQVREVEAWLEGKIPGNEDPPTTGGIFGIPERLFGFVASLAGFGDEEIRTKSISFVPEALE